VIAAPQERKRQQNKPLGVNHEIPTAANSKSNRSPQSVVAGALAAHFLKLVLVVRQIGLTQVELALKSASRFISQRPLTVKFIDPLALGCD
jgi:hypothetical protein